MSVYFQHYGIATKSGDTLQVSIPTKTGLTRVAPPAGPTAEQQLADLQAQQAAAETAAAAAQAYNAGLTPAADSDFPVWPVAIGGGVVLLGLGILIYKRRKAPAVAGYRRRAKRSRRTRR